MFLRFMVELFPQAIELVRQQQVERQNSTIDAKTLQCDDRRGNTVTGIGAGARSPTTKSMALGAMTVRSEVVDCMLELQRVEENYCELGRRLFRSTTESGSAPMVNALFGLLPTFVAQTCSHHLTHSAPRRAKAAHRQTSMNGAIFIIPAINIERPDVIPTAMITEMKRSDGDTAEIIIPLWGKGRWHVAILRSTGKTVLIDPWGLHDFGGMYVRSLLCNAFQRAVLTP